MHSLAARKILATPALITQARCTLARWRAQAAEPVPSYFLEWGRVLDGSPEEIAAFLVSTSKDATRLRQSSPFTNLLTPEERSKIYEGFARADVAVMRSRRMHESVAKRLLREPALAVQALERLEKLRVANPHGRRYHDRWQELLQGPLVEVVRVMTESSEMADVLRKESPFTVFVSPVERQRIFDSTRAAGSEHAPRDRWRTENEAAIVAYNSDVDKNGAFVDQHRAAYLASFEAEHGPVDPLLTAWFEDLLKPRLQQVPVVKATRSEADPDQWKSSEFLQNDPTD